MNTPTPPEVSAAPLPQEADERIEQIRRAHASAKPTHHNPAWMNAHGDLGFALSYIAELRSALDAMTVKAMGLALENKQLNRLLDVAAQDKHRVDALLTKAEAQLAAKDEAYRLQFEACARLGELEARLAEAGRDAERYVTAEMEE